MAMAPVPTSESRKNSDSQAKQNQTFAGDQNYYRSEAKVWLALSIAGALVGLSAPGHDQWFLAWFGLIPLFLAVFNARSVPEAFHRGLHFGFSYTLVYNICILQFTTDVWPETIGPYIAFANPVVWILIALQQGALYGTLCSVVKWMPLTSKLLPEKRHREAENGKPGWMLPALYMIPLVWCLIFNKLGNSWGSLGFTWGLLEYTQYNQKALIQIASWVGGIGVGALIVAVNVALTSLIVCFSDRKEKFTGNFSTSRASSVASLGLVVLLVSSTIAFGLGRLNNAPTLEAKAPHETVSVLQGNILFDANAPDPQDFFRKYLKLAEQSPPGICVWPEWAIPESVTKMKADFLRLGYYSQKLNQDWVVGCLDSDEQERVYNSACGVDRKGTLYPEVYHKRFLVPFGEYTPAWILHSPFGVLCGTLTPRREGYSPGDKQTILDLSGHKIGPVLCCEMAAPELTTEASRKGAQLLVDCSNTSWFDPELVGKQCIAASIFRAVETHRCFVFSTTLGPSAVINAEGIIVGSTEPRTYSTVSRRVPLYSDMTPFALWFR